MVYFYKSLRFFAQKTKNITQRRKDDAKKKQKKRISVCNPKTINIDAHIHFEPKLTTN